MSPAHKHWMVVAELGCLITRAPNPTLHHAHGGSMKDRGIHRSMGRKTSDWLVIPLARELHVGARGIDVIGVKRWERLYRPQADMLDEIAWRTGTDVWALAREEERGMVSRETLQVIRGGRA